MTPDDIRERAGEMTDHSDLIARLRDYINNTDDCALRVEAAAALTEQAATLTAANYQVRELRKLLTSEIAIADAVFSKLGVSP